MLFEIWNLKLPWDLVLGIWDFPTLSHMRDDAIPVAAFTSDALVQSIQRKLLLR